MLCKMSEWSCGKGKFTDLAQILHVDLIRGSDHEIDILVIYFPWKIH